MAESVGQNGLEQCLHPLEPLGLSGGDVLHIDKEHDLVALHHFHYFDADNI